MHETRGKHRLEPDSALHSLLGHVWAKTGKERFYLPYHFTPNLYMS